MSYFGRAAEGLDMKSSAHRPGVRRRPRGRADDPRAAARRAPGRRPDRRGGQRTRRRASGRRWIVDPLDGTVNFLYGLPHLGREHRARGRRGPRGGRRVQPRRRESASARCAARGAVMNGRPHPRDRLPDARPRHGRHRLLLRGRAARATRRRRCSRGSSRAFATSGGRAPPRSIWPTWRAGAWTPTTSAASSGGTRPPAGCWSRRRAAWSSDLEGEPAGVLAAATPQLAALLEQEVD